MKFVLRHLELILTAAGLVVIFGVTALVHPAATSQWAVAAITATLVGVIHGILFWIIRRRQRLARQAALAETERMLRDVIINQVAVIRLGIDMQSSQASTNARAAATRIEEALAAIHLTVSDISEESLARWHSRYGMVGKNLPE